MSPMKWSKLDLTDIAVPSTSDIGVAGHRTPAWCANVNHQISALKTIELWREASLGHGHQNMA